MGGVEGPHASAGSGGPEGMSSDENRLHAVSNYPHQSNAYAHAGSTPPMIPRSAQDDSFSALALRAGQLPISASLLVSTANVSQDP